MSDSPREFDSPAAPTPTELQRIQAELHVLQAECLSLKEELRCAREDLEDARASRRQSASESLRSRDARLRTLMQTIPDLVWLKDTQGVYLACNSMFERFFGAKEEDIVGKTDYDFVDRELADFFREHDRKAIAAGRPSSNEEWINMADDGSRVYLETIKTPVHDDAGTLIGVLGIGRDITDRARAQDALMDAKLRAENSERLKDVFIANISHEIRTPLNIILGYTGIIEERFQARAMDGEARYFDSVRRGGERLLRTVDMILNVSRLQAGELTLHPAVVDIPELIRRIVADHQPLAQKKNLALSIVDECGSACIVVDEYCITQAVSNLVHNAIKFTIAGSVQLRVYRDREGRVALSCSDTGIGIAEHYLPLLFSRYSQEQAGYSRAFEGLGLGMALVKEYLAVNNATIGVESKKGVGTIFTITFLNSADPQLRTVDEQRGVPAPRDGSPAPGGSERTGKRSVLLIEDDEMTIELMDVVLHEGWEVHSARSGPEAWEVLRATHVDIILMDISLSGGQTGIELTQEIRQSPAHRIIPIIAVTAHAYDSDRENCLDAGCDDFLRKPVSSRVLLDAMDRLLGRR